MWRKQLYLLCVFMGVQLRAQQFRTDHFGIKEGLSQNTVNCILKDSEGYYWFGTQDGLNRYDGYSVKIFRNDRSDTTSLSDNFVLQIVEDDWGNLWIGTRNGLNHYNKATNTFTRVWMNAEEKKEFHSSTRYLFKSSHGDILFCSGTVTYGSITKADAQEPPFAITKHDGLFLAGDGKYYGIHNRADDKFTIYSADDKEIGSVMLDHKKLQLGRIPLAVWHDKIFLGENGVWTISKDHTAESVYPSLKEKTVRIVYADRRGNLWLGTNDGLYVVSDEKGELRLLAHNSEDKYSPGGNGIEGMYEDPDGIMWIGTAEGGVNIYDPLKEVFVHMDSQTKPALPSNMVWTCFQDHEKLFVGTNAGMSTYIFKSENLSDVERNLLVTGVISEKTIGDKVVTCMAKDQQGKIWFGTKSKGVAVYDLAKNTWRNYTKELAVIRQAVVSHLFCDRDGDMWISTQAGLYCYQSSTAEFKFYAPSYFQKGGLPAGYIFSTSQDKKGFIWIASTNGLFRYNKATDKFKIYQTQPGAANSLSYNMPTGTYEDSKGRFWVCTLGGGVNLMDREKETFINFTKKDGLANDVAYCMLEDKQGHLWISTNGGLSKFDPAKKTFENFGAREGVISNEFTLNAAYKNKNGELLFGSPEGLVIFNPDSIKSLSNSIPVVLTDLRINYKSVNPAKDIDLFYKDKTITFQFAAVDWRRQDKLNYQFKLEGFDSQWNHTAGFERVASYSNLPFGDYVFRVRVKAGNGSWQESTFAIALHVIPPFWMKTWFLIMEGALVLGLLILLIKYYSQRKLKKQLREIEVQHRLQLERERISRDLHDHVGSNLTYIISSLDSISDRFEKIPTSQAQLKIESLGEFTRSTMQQLRETIWVINKDSVAIAEFAEKIREHLGKMFSVAEGKKFALAAEGDLQMRLQPSVAIHLFRIVQEAVNNSIKHAGHAQLEVNISVEEKNICVVVSDNGKGFVLQNEIDGHYGLTNMRARTEEMGGVFSLESQPGKGTKVKMSVPLK